MSTDQVIVIRHGQKPTANPKHRGVREDGTNDSESLTVRGWLHAGALAAVFAEIGNRSSEGRLNKPDFIYAAGIGKKRAEIDGKTVSLGSHSRRPLETITPMALRLGLTPVTAYSKGEEQVLVKDVLARHGTVLICWQHEEIPNIGNLIVGSDSIVPQSWPENRYDLIWVFDLRRGSWKFRQFFHARLVTA